MMDELLPLRGLPTPTTQVGERAQGEGFRLEPDVLAHDALLPRMTPAAFPQHLR
jgi:hypothetical protein